MYFYYMKFKPLFLQYLTHAKKILQLCQKSKAVSIVINVIILFTIFTIFTFKSFTSSAQKIKPATILKEKKMTKITKHQLAIPL